MSDCISLIDTRADLKKVAQWVNVSQMTHILHVQEVQIRSVAGGVLDIEPFCIKDMDCRIVGVVVYHCCGTGAIHSFDSEVISHVYQDGADTCVKLSCWQLNPKCVADDPDICWTPDPCQRLEELRCVEMDWLVKGKKTQWSFRDSSGSTSYLSESRLRFLISEAEAACDNSRCFNSRCATYRCPAGC